MMRTVVAGVWLVTLPFLVGAAVLAFKMKGHDAPAMEEAAGLQTGPTLAFIGLVGLAHVAGGLACGLAAALLARWAMPGRRILGPTVFLAAVLFWVYARDVVSRPVFYEPFFYQSNAVTAALMSFVTDTLSPLLLDVAAAVLLVAALGAGIVRRRGNRRIAQTAAAVLALAAIGWTVSTVVPESETPAASKRLNVLLLGSDSLRPDRLQALDAERSVMPNLDALAREGVVFRNAFVPLARTLPSIASLLTGCDPHTHGLRHMFPPRHRRTVRRPTLPQLLRPHGYRSEVVTDYAGEMFRLVDLGFDAVNGPPAFSLSSVIQNEIIKHTPAFLPFFNHPLGHEVFPVLRFLPSNADPDWLADRLLDRLDVVAGNPFFLTGFFSTTHTPYAAPHPGYKLYAQPGYEGPNEYAFFVRSLELMDQLEAPLPPEEVAQIRALYDGCCTMVDAAFGRVVAEVKRRGLWDNTVIVVFSDHGEHLYEPGNTSDHGKWFRGDEANRIPLIIAGGPIKNRGRVIDDVVRTIDLLPTLLGLLDVDTPPDVEGSDLGPRMRGGTVPATAAFAETGVWLDAATTFGKQPGAFIYPSVDRLLTVEDGDVLVLRDAFNGVVEEAKHRAMRTGRWKLVYVPTKDGHRYELYDTVADPANLTDLGPKRPDLVKSLGARLRRWMLRDPGKRFDERGHLVPAWDYYE